MALPLAVPESFENHEHWSAVKDVCHRLSESGHRALLAGGCVRDLLMGRVPNDFDVATDATPDQVLALWPGAIMVGKAFGVSILPFAGFQVEVATFRQDLEYRDGRRPVGVRFSTPEEDAKRRDFTVNALFFDLETNEVLDFVGGRGDLARKCLRTVGTPELRFNEDKLRILRAVRFAAQLGFEIETKTLEAIVRLGHDVTQVSRERVRDELFKLLKAPKRERGLKLLLDTRLLDAIFPALAREVRAQGEQKWLARLAKIGASESLASFIASLAAFFAPELGGAAPAKAISTALKSLKLDNHLVESVTFVLRSEATLNAPGSLRLGELLLLLFHPEASAARAFAAAGQGASAEATHELDRITRRFVDANGGKLPPAFLSGDDAKAHGQKPGPEMGRLLHEGFLLQLEGKFADRAAALDWLKSQL